MNAEAVQRLELATTLRAVAEVEAAAAVFAQTNRIKDALAAGVSTADVMGVTGLSRARIYQIRDGRR